MSGTSPSQGMVDLEDLLLKVDAVAMQQVHLRLAGDVLVIEGAVPTYKAKRQAEELAAQVNLTVLNCLRVVPGAFERGPPAIDAPLGGWRGA